MGRATPSHPWRNGATVQMTERVAFAATDRPDSPAHGGANLEITEKCVSALRDTVVFEATQRGRYAGVGGRAVATHYFQVWRAGWFRDISRPSLTAQLGDTAVFNDAKFLATDWPVLARGDPVGTRQFWNGSVASDAGRHTAIVRTVRVGDIGYVPGAGHTTVFQTDISTDVWPMTIRVRWWFAAAPGIVVKWRAGITGLLASKNAIGDTTISFSGGVTAYRFGGSGPMTAIGLDGG